MATLCQRAVTVAGHCADPRPATGNAVRESEIDAGLWSILSEAFGGRVGISGDAQLDFSADSEDEETNDKESKADVGAKNKLPPVAQLATALQGGMEAIAASLGSRPTGEDHFRSLTVVLLQQHEATRRF
ncbi:unnamed protein product [Phytophthora fragariaefolia]|uniref:Unnamed protein product n=1 Tax=Phytophthora fragariaefolia TaxID=1490495 RepID=A0A9W6X500_9STRA|nr:unnamed protein product [Phytophthora fragariaefolia]